MENDLYLFALGSVGRGIPGCKAMGRQRRQAPVGQPKEKGEAAEGHLP